LVEFEDGEVAPTARAWFDKDETSPLYSDAEGLLYFLDKYTTIMVGGAKEMSRFYKNNKGKTLLDKVSVSDIAYSVLIYESSYDVWMEDIKKSETCATKEEEKAFKHVAENKYHVQRGTRLPMYRDGWTSEGRAYFDTICGEIRNMMGCEKLWSTLKSHWETYGKKYHKYSYVLKEVNTNIGEDVAESEDEDDDNCVVYLPGDDDDDDDDDGGDEQGREKRQRQMWAV
jgi:hypothetical protein